MNKVLAYFFLVCVLIGPVSAMAAERTLSPAEQFIQNVGDHIIKLIRSTESMSEKKEHFRQTLREKFDMESIGRFVLSRYWRQATAPEKKEFLRLFEQNMVDSYTSQFDEYKDETMQVKSSRVGSDGEIWVSAQVRGSEREPVELRWKVYEKNGSFKIYDIYVNEASMGITHRSEYASIIQKHGGKIAGLLDELKSSKERRAES